MKGTRPSELELQVLAVLWERGPSAVKDVRESLPDGKDRAYTTVLSVLQVMEKKGLVGHTREGQAHHYHALAKRGTILRPFMRELVRNVFGGSPARAFQSLLDGSSIDEQEFAQIKKMIKDAEHRASSEGDPS